MQIIKTVRSNLGKASAAATALFVSSGAFAAVDTTVTTALSDAKADVGTVGAAAFLVILAAVGFKYLRRAL